MLHSSGKYPDFKLTATLLKLVLALGCCPLIAAPKSRSNRGTPALNLVTTEGWGARMIFAELKQRAGNTFDLVIDTNPI